MHAIALEQAAVDAGLRTYYTTAADSSLGTNGHDQTDAPCRTEMKSSTASFADVGARQTPIVPIRARFTNRETR